MSKFSRLASITAKFPFRSNRKLMHGAIGGLAVLVILAPLPAMANLIFGGQVIVGGSGFGNLPRALTIQSHGPSTNTESGCIAPGLTSGAGACAGNSIGGDEASPIGFPKQSAPSLSSLGITSASQIGILFDAVQPQNANNATVTINDLTLKLYSGVTLLTTAVLVPDDLMLLTNPGNGSTDYLFLLDTTQAALFDSMIAGAFSDVLALDATLSFPNQSAGSDSFALVNTNNPVINPQCVTAPCSIPEPGSFGLVVMCLFGLVGLGTLRRKIRLV